MTQPRPGQGEATSPATLAADAARRQHEAQMPPEQRVQELSEELARAVDELLARDVDGAEEAAVLERAQKVVNDALGEHGLGRGI
ncbi:hypothetical protein GC425_00025 [Corynebacterium sp. zg254]|uniref:Uncharacterized protein n=1 Tax=Corynebacterium zhongnanshanii TaxID=2768834 RepID=A0ABQ6VGN0_9CORY|nr:MULTISPECIES: hypothetical protein [Corynebacterium]KAB3523574.1 hypothetical protein F8377_05605 [Corynebacterium zhongnanshanii]MCR5913263.1 hypothetical protein [Corynebacterium sp. zg254]